MLANMGRIMRQISLLHGDRTALINMERGRRFTYRQMHDLSNRVSNFLRDHFSLGEGDFYATLLANEHMGLFHPWMLKSPVGAAWIDVRESTAEQLDQIDRAAPGLVFCEAAVVPAMYEPLEKRGIAIVSMDPPRERFPGVHLFWDLVEAASVREIDEDVAADDPYRHISVLRFTGGTTGRAKCAMYSLSNLWTWGCNPAHYYETFPYDHPRAMFFSPINHAASGSVVIPLHIKGGTVATLNKAEVDQVGRAIAQEKIEMIYAVPTVLYRMLDTGLNRKYDLSSLKTIRYGAAPITPSKLEELLHIFGPIFVQGYGSTECWPSVTILGRHDHGTDTPDKIRRLASVGQPFPGEEVIICDDAGNPLAPGEHGELWIRGPNTIAGYYQDPELTREHFSPNGFWFSGDIGYMDELGYVYLVDRKKDLIISGGYNVYASEVENCLNSHPAVENSAVVGLPDDDWGEAVCAVVMLGSGCRASTEELVGHCKKNLARYKAPKRIYLVNELPLSSAGKVLRREVRASLRQMDMD
jgi:fatty-acyl-CoA synthase